MRGAGQLAGVFPVVPTIAESGYPGYEASNWHAYVTRARTPRAIIEQLNHSLVNTLSAAEVREQSFTHGREAQPSSSFVQ